MKKYISKIQNKLTTLIKQEKGGFETGGLLMFALIGVIAASAFYAASQAYENHKTTSTRDNLSYISTRGKNVFSREGYGSVTTALGIKLNVVPKELVRGTTATNQFGGNLTLSQGDDATEMKITITKIPESACIELAADKDAWQKITVGGTVVSGTSSAAANVCSGNSNTLEFHTR